MAGREGIRKPGAGRREGGTLLADEGEVLYLVRVGDGEILGLVGVGEALGLVEAGEALDLVGVGEALSKAGFGEALSLLGVGEALSLAGFGEALSLAGFGEARTLVEVGEALGLVGLGEGLNLATRDLLDVFLSARAEAASGRPGWRMGKRGAVDRGESWEGEPVEGSEGTRRGKSLEVAGGAETLILRAGDEGDPRHSTLLLILSLRPESSAFFSATFILSCHFSWGSMASTTLS